MGDQRIYVSMIGLISKTQIPIKEKKYLFPKIMLARFEWCEWSKTVYVLIFHT